jgi:two-component system, OmpR family, alkaline phosphatase synthesis response regulator PhoP
MKRLLLVEDDRALATGLSDAFRLEGFEVTATRDGAKGGELALTRDFDVVVLDLMLPGRNGLDLLRELRAKGRTTPVLVLTARGEEADKVVGLEVGADDYVTKPFSLRELVARVRALVRRAGAGARGGRGGRGDAGRDEAEGAGEIAPAKFELGDARVDLAAFTLARGGTTHALSRREAALLALLFERRGRAVSREQILKLAWDDGGDHVGTRTIDTHVLNLRQKLEADPARPKWLLTVHGVGYRLASDASDATKS